VALRRQLRPARQLSRAAADRDVREPSRELMPDALLQLLAGGMSAALLDV